MNSNRDMIRDWISAFVRDCKSRELSPHTILYYQTQLEYFRRYCDEQGIEYIRNIVPDTLRSYLIYLEETHHNPGGRHNKYRAVRVFMIWWENEVQPQDWLNPVLRVRPPKVTLEPIIGVSIEDIRALITTCNSGMVGRRDVSIFEFLLDTGVRISELLALNREHVDLVRGDVIVYKGKGGKPRTVFLGKKSRRALRVYLDMRLDEQPALWITEEGDRLKKKSVQGMMVRRANKAGVPPPSPHDFRRQFALSMLRAKVDVFSLMRLMGHTTLEMLQRYLAQTTEDMRIAHEVGGPVDKLV